MGARKSVTITVAHDGVVHAMTTLDGESADVLRQMLGQCRAPLHADGIAVEHVEELIGDIQSGCVGVQAPGAC